MQFARRMAALFAASMFLFTACSSTGTGGEALSKPQQPESAPNAASGGGAKEEIASSGSAGTADGALPGVNAENYPRIDGSTANMPLLAQIYSEVCGVSLEEAETAVNVSGGTGAVWRNMMDGNTDILLVYEAPQAIQEEIAQSGLNLDIQPIGRDALVFMVNTQNPVNNLTEEQLRDIYTGKVTDWGDVGGQAGEIAPFQRNEESGSQTLFLKLLMKETAPMTPPKELVPGFMGELIDAVAEYNGSGGAIGYSVYYYAKQMYANPNLKLLSVNGVEPSPQTIGDSSYPLVNDFYVVIRTHEAADSPARKLRDWLLTDAGRKALETAGYVPAQ